MQERKIRLLVCPSDKSGVGAYRSLWPHEYLQEHYGDEFDVDIVYLHDFPRQDLSKFLTSYDIIIFHKQIDRDCKVLDMIKFLNIPTVMDIDDNYNIGKDHPLYLTSVREKLPEKIVAHLRKADYITTTTQIFADELKKHNKNVYILPNAINPEIKQFQQVKNPSDRIRFGIVCGSAHLKDIELLSGIASLPKEVRDKIQICLCGFDLAGKITYWDKDTGESKTRDILPRESCWVAYENILTNHYSTVDPIHKEWLNKFMPVDDPFNDDCYRRFYTKNINEYAKHYENVDVLLAPLKINEFNRTKSQLKAIECAFTGTALIASDFGPYTIDLVPYIEKGGSINPNGNALLVDPMKNHKLWSKYITYIVNHPECIKIMSENLKRDLINKYSMEKVTEDRVNLYRKIFQERNK